MFRGSRSAAVCDACSPCRSWWRPRRRHWPRTRNVGGLEIVAAARALAAADRALEVADRALEVADRALEVADRAVADSVAAPAVAIRPSVC